MSINLTYLVTCKLFISINSHHTKNKTEQLSSQHCYENSWQQPCAK